MASVCQLQLLLSDAFFSLISELVVALCILTYKHGYILSIEMVLSKKKAERNKGKSQRGTIWRNLNSKYSCWMLRMCEK